jgi:tetratricopeptide (TPR) repeat protein
VGVLYFSVTLFPALGFFDVYPFRFSFVADHFQYVASVGIIALAVAAVTRVASGLSLWPRRTLAASGLLALSLLAGKAWSQGYIYKDPETLWRDTVKRNPSSWHRHYDLATILARQGKFEEAVVHFSETLKLKSDSADAYNNLGNVPAAQGKTQEAISHYTEALRIDPDHREARYNLAVVLVGNGRVEDAITHLSEHLRISPDHGEAHYNLGVILAEHGKLQEALSQFSDAVRLHPGDVSARRNLELCRRLLGKSPATSKEK